MHRDGETNVYPENGTEPGFAHAHSRDLVHRELLLVPDTLAADPGESMCTIAFNSPEFPWKAKPLLGLSKD